MSDSPADRALPAPRTEERERVISLLGGSFARDHLTMAELEERIAAAYRAESTHALAALTSDLPDQTAPDAVAVVPHRVSAVLSSCERMAPETVEGGLHVHGIAGHVELDLSRTRSRPGTTEISLHLLASNLEIRLPPHVRVENQARSLLASFAFHDVGEDPALAQEGEHGVVVRFTGRMVLSALSATPGQAPGAHHRRES